MCFYKNNIDSLDIVTLAGLTFASFQSFFLVSLLPCQTTIRWSMKINIFSIVFIKYFLKNPTVQDNIQDNTDIQDNTQLSKFL